MTRNAPLVGVYPGTFDPITHGHTDIIHRATKVVDRMVVGVAENAGKSPLFSVQERVELVQQELDSLNTNGAEVEVRAFDNLLIHFVHEMGASVILRGLRAVSDFEYEFQMACMNTRMDPNVETVFLTASERQQFISARFVKEIAALQGDISSFVSPNVARAVTDRFRNSTAPGDFAGRTARD
ncbi:Phosphopantetheine adenylyltransferase [Limimonas halophila]|uniref:Phosphopantetheine adenylyltransferase n=1 Tax=Limimonas halophila TaxID=1082479 RepID=A0A1G7NDY0_9PROT|nr:pantetheine-phosphate adenylyltransferase [Limimonas halophila]SDF72117.1 Phosphopantetheine adenylyltransferase [Limimonas halophila]